ncbi:unnamed protein product, partial [Arabidopsis halleri]
CDTASAFRLTEAWAFGRNRLNRTEETETFGYRR